MKNYLNKRIEYSQSATIEESKIQRALARRAYLEAQLQILRDRNILWPLKLQTEALPEAGKVAVEMKSELTNLAKVKDAENDLLIGTWNMLFLDAFKARYFIDTYKEVLACHHLLAVEEVNLQALSIIGRACGYGYFTSSPNSRGQAVGYLIHPRLEVVGRVEYPQITGIFGIPDLRPALQLDLYDNITRRRFTVIVVHLKSMRGGEKITGVVRFKQLQKLMEIIGTSKEPTIILGDFNCHLGYTINTNPLTEGGFSLFESESEISTQAMGGRLDGMFEKNLCPGLKLGTYSVHKFWSNKAIGGTLSDHALLSWKMTCQQGKAGCIANWQVPGKYAYLAQAA